MLTRPARDVEPSRVVDAVEHGMRLTVRRSAPPICWAAPGTASSWHCRRLCRAEQRMHASLLCPPPFVPPSATPSAPLSPSALCLDSAFLPSPLLLQGYNEFSLLSLSCSDYLSLPSVRPAPLAAQSSKPCLPGPACLPERLTPWPAAYLSRHGLLLVLSRGTACFFLRPVPCLGSLSLFSPPLFCHRWASKSRTD